MNKTVLILILILGLSLETYYLINFTVSKHSVSLDNNQNVVTITKTDTIWYAKLTPVYIEHIKVRTDTVYDTVTIVSDYMAVKYYEQRLDFDTLGFADLKIQISNNSLKGLQYTSNIRSISNEPLNESIESYRFFAGFRLGDTIIEPTIGLQTRRFMFGMGVNVRRLERIYPTVSILYKFN